MYLLLGLQKTCFISQANHFYLIVQILLSWNSTSTRSVQDGDEHQLVESITEKKVMKQMDSTEESENSTARMKSLSGDGCGQQMLWNRVHSSPVQASSVHIFIPLCLNSHRGLSTT